MLEEGELVTKDGAASVSLADALRAGLIEATREFHHAPTEPSDENGQGNAPGPSPSPPTGRWSMSTRSRGWSGSSRWPPPRTRQALNPPVTGQIEGGIAQGIGLAVMEEIVVDQGPGPNPFTDYLLLPTALDMPPVAQTWIEQPERARHVGPRGSWRAADHLLDRGWWSAIRQATGLLLT